MRLVKYIVFVDLDNDITPEQGLGYLDDALIDGKLDTRPGVNEWQTGIDPTEPPTEPHHRSWLQTRTNDMPNWIWYGMWAGWLVGTIITSLFNASLMTIVAGIIAGPVVIFFLDKFITARKRKVSSG